MVSPIQKWFYDLRMLWLQKQPERIVDILASSFEYFEDPFESALTTPQEVIFAWEEIKQQKIEHLQIDIIYENEDGAGIAIWQFKAQGLQKHIGCYFIKLDENGKCKHFRQFWNLE